MNNSDIKSKIKEALQPVVPQIKEFANALTSIFEDRFHRNPSPNDRIEFQELDGSFIGVCNGEIWCAINKKGEVFPL